jgi:hypothetical protein
LGLDIRLPIGALFTILGVLLAGYGLGSNAAIYQRSMGINVNLIWGMVLLVFGLVMILLGRRGVSHGSKLEDRNPPAKTQPK